MSNSTRLGDATLRAKTQSVNTGNRKSFRASTRQPTPAAATVQPADPPNRFTLEQSCLALIRCTPGGQASPRLLHIALENRSLSAITKAVERLAARGLIVEAQPAATPEETQWTMAHAPIPPPPAIPAAVAARSAAPALTLGDLAFQNRRWPRMFTLPGLQRYLDYDAEAVCAHLALTFLDFQAELHDLVAVAAQTRPAEAAALAEAVALMEQCACMDGLATDLDDIPSGGESPALRLAALAKVQALNRGGKAQ